MKIISLRKSIIVIIALIIVFFINILRQANLQPMENGSNDYLINKESIIIVQNFNFGKKIHKY